MYENLILIFYSIIIFLNEDCENSNMNINTAPIYCGNSMNNNCPPHHKNSIPDIILTFSGKFIKNIRGHKIFLKKF